MNLDIKNLIIKVDNFRLKIDYFSIKSGEYVYIIGPTGSGKTLLLECIAGFVTPESGEIKFDNFNMNKISPEKRNVGFMYQNYHLFPHLNVKKNIEFGLKMKKINDYSFFEYIINKLGIKHLLDRKIQNLSGGEKQRVALARALVIKPRILLLDEPLSALDQDTKTDILKLLHELNLEYNLTTIHVTHDKNEIINDSRIFKIKNGILMEEENVQEYNYNY
ncbi:ATP-binding cassette domain-containing protein [Marinitoga litoralis]|uniref:ATP-binding cassette domain-containing protein n=1 Tax=Marinitoga litoralis TaxID=570855 RepID=UPI0019612368|nr:ATP-binding cassette domain-containing protein [Marinitoga litoralis]MBM7558369.1 molybdate/tungstate transport system ATP-binding protein [Marinitoga litoralis]